MFSSIYKKINHFIINLIKVLFKLIKCNLSKLIKEMLNKKKIVSDDINRDESKVDDNV